MNRLFKRFITLIYTNKCVFCNTVIEGKYLACESCYEKVSDRATIKTVLKNTYCVSPFPYDDIYKQAVKNLKYGKNKYYADTMAYYIVASIRENYDINMFDCITYVPLTKKQLKDRGFNNAQVLAKAVAKMLCIPCEECLVKIKENQYQHTLKRELRADNVKGAFEISDKEIKGRNILVIDDVITTGATLNECSKVLKRNKNLVYCATFCKA